MMQANTLPDLQRFAQDAGAALSGESDGAQPDAGAADSGSSSFEELLKSKPEYKNAYDARVKRAIEGRFRQMKQLEDRQKQAAPLLKAVAQRYGLNWEDGSDIQPLMDALQADTAPAGRESAKKALMDQVAAIRRQHPGFRLEREMQRPAFGRLVAQGVPLAAAYSLSHQPEAIAEAMGYAIARTRQAMADQLRTGRQRPPENGLHAHLSAPAAPDPKAMSPQQRKNLRDRVARGEKVYW